MHGAELCFMNKTKKNIISIYFHNKPKNMNKNLKINSGILTESVVNFTEPA